MQLSLNDPENEPRNSSKTVSFFYDNILENRIFFSRFKISLPLLSKFFIFWLFWFCMKSILNCDFKAIRIFWLLGRFRNRPVKIIFNYSIMKSQAILIGLTINFKIRYFNNILISHISKNQQVASKFLRPEGIKRWILKSFTLMWLMKIDFWMRVVHFCDVMIFQVF